MSGAGYPYDQSSYYASSAYYSIPQYTQHQLQVYYAQYGCLPPQPYHTIPDNQAYSQPASAESSIYSRASTQSAAQAPSSHGASGPGMSNQPHRSRSRAWTCTQPDCTSTANFTRLADLQRHEATVHGMGTPDFPCTVSDCSRVGEKGFTRRDHLVEHLRNFHHIDVPKRKAGERSAYPLGFPSYQ